MKAWTSLLVIGFAGCGGGGSAFEGMYSFDTWNENTTSCADPGPSVLELHSQTVFYLKNESLLGHSFLSMVGCDTAAECEMKAHDDTIDLDLNFPFYENGNDEDGWTENDAYGFEDFTDPTMCQGTIVNATLTADGDTGVQVRIETIHTPLYPVPASGECDDGAMAAGAGVPCSELEVIHGTRTGDI